MRIRLAIAMALATLGCVLGAVAQEKTPERQMNVRQGPETVFDRPSAEILPALAATSRCPLRATFGPAATTASKARAWP